MRKKSTALIATLVLLWMGRGMSWGQEGGYPPEQRVKKFSFEFSTDRVEYTGNYFNRTLFLGEDYQRTRIAGEYQYTAAAFYQFTHRLSLGARGGFVETQLVDPLMYSDPRLFSVFYPMARRVLQCAEGAGNFCADPNPIIEDVLDFRAYSFQNLEIEQKEIPGKLGELKQVPLSLGFRYDLMLKTRWRPFIGGSVGYTFNDFSDNNSAARAAQALIESVPYTGTQSMCAYLKSQILDGLHNTLDQQLRCGEFMMPDGTTVPGLFMGGNQFFLQGAPEITDIDWRTEVPSSLTWGLETGFAWTLSRRWDFLAGARFTWYDKKVRSTINGSDQPLYLAYADVTCDDPTRSDCVQEFIEGANSSGQIGDIGPDRINDELFDFIRLEPGKFKLDVWHFSFGFKYTFNR